jgi:hypothetical protein
VKSFTTIYPERTVGTAEGSHRPFSRRALRGLALIPGTIALAIVVAACAHPLPEQGSDAERVYADRCGSCHRPYQPHAMTAAMWQVQMQVMRQKIAAAGQPPLTPDQDRAILDYLTRNAGG